MELTKEQQLFLAKLPESVKIEGSFASNQVYVNGQPLPLGPSLKLHNHSPTGFNWGYGGSGPAQLALALLMKFTGNEAQKYYQQFKFSWIAGLPRTDFIKTVNLREIMYNILITKQ